MSWYKDILGIARGNVGQDKVCRIKEKCLNLDQEKNVSISIFCI